MINKTENKVEKSRITQSCFIEETLDNWSLDKGQYFNVKTLRRVLEVLEDEGFGDYDIRVGYDCNYAYTGIRNDFNISNKTIQFQE